MNSSRLVTFVTSAMVVLLIAACAGMEPKPQLPVVVVKDVYELFEKTRDINPIYDTLRGQARVSVSSPSDNYRVTEMIFSKKPSFLRLETTGPLGETLLILTTDLKRVFIYSPMENRYYSGLASRKNLSMLIPLPFKAAEIVGLLQGRVDMMGYSPREMTFDVLSGIYEMTLLPRESGTGMAVLTVDGRTFSILTMRQYDTDNNLIIDGAFKDFSEIEGKAFPMTLSYKVPDGGTFISVGLSYNTVEVGTPIDDSRFSLEPPHGVQEIDLDKSIINFVRTPVQ